MDDADMEQYYVAMAMSATMTTATVTSADTDTDTTNGIFDEEYTYTQELLWNLHHQRMMTAATATSTETTAATADV